MVNIDSYTMVEDCFYKKKNCHLYYLTKRASQFDEEKE